MVTNPPTRPQLPGDPDPLTVEPEPVEPWRPSAAANPGCGTALLVALAFAIGWLA